MSLPVSVLLRAGEAWGLATACFEGESRCPSEDPDQPPGPRRLPQSGEHVMGLQDQLLSLPYVTGWVGESHGSLSSQI